MYLDHLTPAEMERIAYMTGDTMAAAAFDLADGAQDEIDELEATNETA